MPTKVMQTITRGPHANCMNACLASYFSIEIDKTPKFKNDYNWHRILRKWLKPYGMGFATVDVPNEEFFIAELADGYQIVCGESHRGMLHATIYHNGKLWHDPHPSGLGLAKVTQVNFFYPLIPEPL